MRRLVNSYFRGLLLIGVFVVTLTLSVSFESFAAGYKFPYDKAKAIILKARSQATFVGYRDEGNGVVTVIYTMSPQHSFAGESRRFILITTDNGQKWLSIDPDDFRRNTLFE